MANLTASKLAKLIDEAATAAAADDDHAQACLWFGDEPVSFGQWAGVAYGISRASVTTHRPGGGVARGGDHIDFGVELSDWRDWDRPKRVRKARRWLELAADWAAENLGAVEPEVETATPEPR